MSYKCVKYFGSSGFSVTFRIRSSSFQGCEVFCLAAFVISLFHIIIPFFGVHLQ
jgi:hypothetical protein